MFDVVYSNQEHMKVDSFNRSDLADSDFDDSEDSYLRNSDACMANCFNSVGFSLLPNVLSQSVHDIDHDSDCDDSEDSYERNANACFANWHNQEDKLPDSENSNACFSDYFPSTSV